ncbi:conserved membrane domain protein, partial [Chlamydia psittaci 84-8471/1]
KNDRFLFSFFHS